MKSTILIGSALLVSALPSAASAEPVLLISIDGLQPADVIEAEKRGIDIPNLKRFITQGSYAQGVRGILPTVTYPSHATLITGVSPSRHGILGNNSFDLCKSIKAVGIGMPAILRFQPCGMSPQRQD